MGLLDNKVALITGGARGMGRAHAVACAQEGADVILFDAPGPVETLAYPLATAEDLDEAVALVEREGRRAIAVRGDVRSQADLDGAVERAVSEFGRIDILIANAGVWNRANFWELNESQWAAVVDINLGGVWRACKAVAPTMIAQRSGSMVLVASINGFEAGPSFAHYTASKHGVIGLMKTYAVELGQYGVRVNALCPGPTLTQLVDHKETREMITGDPNPPAAAMQDAGFNFMALRGVSWIAPEQHAQAALFLNSDLAGSITGTALVVDAGHLALPGHNPNPTR
jgi:SDR family mycofactocin-dependent oxidoreductase